MTEIAAIIDDMWDRRERINPQLASPEELDAIARAVDMLDRGEARVSERHDEKWVVNEWLKKAVLLSFRINDNEFIKGGFTNYYDKVDSKYASYNARDFRESGVRVVPPATARKGAYIAPSCVLMPSYVNIGAYVKGTNPDLDRALEQARSGVEIGV